MAELASTSNALVCFVLATVLWTSVGWAVTSRMLGQSLGLPFAPAMGWAIHNVPALLLFDVVGLNRTSVWVVAAGSIAAASLITTISKTPSPAAGTSGPSRGALAGAMLLALLVMLSLLPSHFAGANTGLLADTLFDHSKATLIDEMVNRGVPPGNPVYGEIGVPDRLVYYYLWHFSAAQLALLTGSSGWEADAALTGFTAMATLLMMMGFACRISGKPAAAWWLLLLAPTMSLRPLLDRLFGESTVQAWTGEPSGLGTWLFQMTWAPQHLAAAGSVMLAGEVLTRLGHQPTIYRAVLLALLAAAAFQSSVWLGGITLPIAVVLIGLWQLRQSHAASRWPFVGCTVVACALAIFFAWPLLHDQLQASVVRQEGLPIMLRPYPVLGPDLPFLWRRVLDVPAFFLVFLVVELAAIYPFGLLMACWFRRDRSISADQRHLALWMTLLVVTGLAVPAGLASTLGPNNDLAWRGLLPAIFALMSLSAAGLATYLHVLPRWYRWAHGAAIVVCLVSGLTVFGGDLMPERQASAGRFVESAAMWQAVRAASTANERVANNPRFLSDMTPWPINISWALLSRRRSCYAGLDLALPFAPLTRSRRNEVDVLFNRVFAGAATIDDLRQMAEVFDCGVVVVSYLDGAWLNDPFARSPWYRLVDSSPKGWRIYRRADAMRVGLAP